jgi:hypothetical protein
LELPVDEDVELKREKEQRLERRPQRWMKSSVVEIGVEYHGRTTVSDIYRFDGGQSSIEEGG